MAAGEGGGERGRGREREGERGGEGGGYHGVPPVSLRESWKGLDGGSSENMSSWGDL